MDLALKGSDSFFVSSCGPSGKVVLCAPTINILLHHTRFGVIFIYFFIHFMNDSQRDNVILSGKFFFLFFFFEPSCGRRKS